VLRQLRTAVILLAIMIVVTGVVYPLLVTGLAQGLFHHKASGSVIEDDGNAAGSELIGQPFSDPKYFWGRLSATSDYPYNAEQSQGSNYGPSNPDLEEAVKQRIEALKAVDPENTEPIPADLVTFSGSGLDPHISPAAALYQVPRVARERGLSEDQVKKLVDRFTEGRQFWFLGERRVNVLKLNMALDDIK
jgi:K+-transporting ATPase KdpC subunit